MNIQIGDTVILTNDSHAVGIVERRSGDLLTIRFPDKENQRRQIPKAEVRALAEAMYEARQKGSKFRNNLSLIGSSMLADLVAAFGYATLQLRQESLGKVRRQLKRAGLRIQPETDSWCRDDHFKLVVFEPQPEPPPEVPPGPSVPKVMLPDPFWPTALGLEPASDEIAFLRALTGAAPLLCLLHLPGDGIGDWLPSVWEGLTSWAYRAAQRFHFIGVEPSTPEVVIGSAAVLHTYLTPSAINGEGFRLRDTHHCLNMITIKTDAETPVELERLRAVWPGAIFDFNPEATDIKSLLSCLRLVAGWPDKWKDDLCPLKTLVWCKGTREQLAARGIGWAGKVFTSAAYRSFKGSNENATALGLKAELAHWLIEKHPEASIRFEQPRQNESGVDSRIDVFVEGVGRFEIETMAGSGPMEAFYHRKVFSRAKNDALPLSLIVPNETVLWAGPFLADLAHHLGDAGRVLIPGAGDSFLRVLGHPLPPIEAIVPPVDVLATTRKQTRSADGILKRADIAGYQSVHERVQNLIIWPEKNRHLMRRMRRSSGILFFGPPGCGKSRLARAIAGELEQEVRLLSPSDLCGAYTGWGQIMIREQFDWVAANERRMLVIDELDAIAHSRSGSAGLMNTDEKACVNELLVQLDRATNLGRLVAGTTNFMSLLDEAVVRSGRFGCFIPIPPPDLTECAAILEYYLRKLRQADDSSKQLIVETPPEQEVCAALSEHFDGNEASKRWFCCADLEEAVNRTYQRCLREALRLRQGLPGDPWPSDVQSLTVRLTRSELEQSLREVPKSVSAKAVRRFLRDVHLYCGPVVAKQFASRFRSGEKNHPQIEERPS